MRLLYAALLLASGCPFMGPPGSVVGIEGPTDGPKFVDATTSEIVGPTPAAAPAGQRSYNETVRWLGEHLAAHANSTTWVDGRLVDQQERLRDQRPCVLIVSLDRRIGRDGPRSLRFIRLAEADRSRIGTCTTSGGALCACLEGTPRLALEVATSGSPAIERRRWIPNDRICFDSRENAVSAAEALLYAAELCRPRT